MRGWAQSTFVFVSTNTHPVQGGVEETWLAVMAELVRLGATVQLLCISGSGFADDARAAGVTVAPYILDKWNVVRSRSRLRKYLKRYEPVCALAEEKVGKENASRRELLNGRTLRDVYQKYRVL